MPHGAQDWYKYRRTAVSYPIDDLAELAARLESIDVFDRRGDVIFLDGFENGLNKWEIQTAGAASTASISPIPVKSGGYSILLAPAIPAVDYARIETLQPYPALTKIGLECAFSFDSNIRYVYLWIGIYTGAQTASARILYSKSAETLSYVTTAAANVAFATNVNLQADIDLFHIAKVVIDINNLTYVRFILDDNEYNLANAVLNITGDATYSHLVIRISASSNDADIGNAYIDNAILTANEP